jgi:hypothetical protein
VSAEVISFHGGKMPELIQQFQKSEQILRWQQIVNRRITKGQKTLKSFFFAAFEKSSRAACEFHSNRKCTIF